MLSRKLLGQTVKFEDLWIIYCIHANFLILIILLVIQENVLSFRKYTLSILGNTQVFRAKKDVTLFSYCSENKLEYSKCGKMLTFNESG